MEDRVQLQQQLDILLDIQRMNPGLGQQLKTAINFLEKQLSPVINIPSGQEDLISFDPIEEGTLMVDFHGEREFGRFYTKESYESMDPKLSPSSRREILPEEVTKYIAHLDPSLPTHPTHGGKRKRTRRRRGKMSYTRLSRKR
jgi:hypothetical protein